MWLTALILAAARLCLSSSLSLHLPAPTDADIKFMEWSKSRGVLHLPCIKLLTTDMSVGGRGLFTTEKIQENSVIASIPRDLIMVTRDEDHWAADLTVQALDAMHSRSLKEYFESWNEAQAGEGGNDRREAFDAATKHDKYSKIRGNYDTYSIVISRAAKLGPSFNGASGIVPFFDMLNHGVKNVDLVSYGTISEKYGNQDSSLHPQDMLLTTTKTLEAGEELFTLYFKGDTTSDKALAQRVFQQYGF